MQVRRSPIRRPAFLESTSPKPEAVKTGSTVYVSKDSGQYLEILANAKGWKEKVFIFESKDAFGIKAIAQTYNEQPIYLVPKELATQIANTFKAGRYGVDTESDFHTHELRLIQVYTGKETYIFDASALEVDPNLGLPKFFRGKDRIKIGIDIETDARRLLSHITEHWKTQASSIYTKPPTINGLIDLQNISRAINVREKPPISMKDLSAEYVPEFTYVDGFHDSYKTPTKEQYIYAANDAAIPYRIYECIFKV